MSHVGWEEQPDRRTLLRPRHFSSLSRGGAMLVRTNASMMPSQSFDQAQCNAAGSAGECELWVEELVVNHGRRGDPWLPSTTRTKVDANCSFPVSINLLLRPQCKYRCCWIDDLCSGWLGRIDPSKASTAAGQPMRSKLVFTVSHFTMVIAADYPIVLDKTMPRT